MKRFVALIIVILMLAGTACQTNVDIVNSGKSVTSDTSAVRKDAASGTSPYQEEPIKAITSTSPVVTTSRTRDDPDHISKWFGDIPLTEEEARAFVKYLNSLDGDDISEKLRASKLFRDGVDLALIDFDEYSVEIDTLNQMIDMGVIIDPTSYKDQIIHYVDLAYELSKMHYAHVMCSYLMSLDLNSENGKRLLASRIEESKKVVKIYDLSKSIIDTLETAIHNGDSAKEMREIIEHDIQYVNEVVAKVKDLIQQAKEMEERLKGNSG
ncbi:MAG TPA: hypothetical protein PL100_01005 [Bacillota bacterium]|jgi:hypothetical protein|nr:hypothetical protein [Bacillota bacterium]HQC48093.1 hypothetical protein [Bacillota bacterium]